MSSIIVVAVGERYLLQNQRQFEGTVEGTVVGAWAAIEEGHPRRGWFPVIVLFRDERGRLWEYQSKAFLDFDMNDPAYISSEHPGGLMSIAVPAGSPFSIPVRPFKPHRS